ncbi:hypothetical protein NIES4071_61270 [Calothrix sp. NIES-4071]|nr:hypothetical protein NIES4071_61270 [Calothrix sp. NIES-4071]BAZ60434.1 hypothetical protein NIES4105_61220 [Calothrix sp. NIES-4105]
MNKRQSRLLPALRFNQSHWRNAWSKGGWLLGILTGIISVPVLADTANFGTVSLAPGFDTATSLVSGYTGGSYSLSAITNRDVNNKVCIGFADPTPDHIIVLQKNFSNLRIAVDSSGSDTTLLVQAPDGKIYCGDDTGRLKDASVTLSQWQEGSYKVWVGVFNPGVKINYTLSVQQP